MSQPPVPVLGEIISLLSQGHRHLVFRAVLAAFLPCRPQRGSRSLVFGKAFYGPLGIGLVAPRTGSPEGGGFQSPAAAVPRNKSVYTVIEYTHRDIHIYRLK